MPEIRNLYLKIERERNIIEEHFLFASDGINKDVCCNLSALPQFKLSDAIDCISNGRDIFETVEYLNFEILYDGIGVLKNKYDNIFILSFYDGVEKYVTCLQLPVSSGYKKTKITMDGYALSLFMHCLSSSQKYVQLCTNYLFQKCHWYSHYNDKCKITMSRLKIQLKEPEFHVMDLTWAKMVCTTIYETHQLRYAMTWLSTLGGAYSALGEKQEQCALHAGTISLRQLRIALRLGDDITVTQCKLFYSLSLIQQGRCRQAKRIIFEQYNALKKFPIVDKKTVNMCKGIWARLKYEIGKKQTSRRQRQCK